MPPTMTHAAPTPAGNPEARFSAPAIREMPAAERPRERLRDQGPGYLNNAELMAILIRTGIEGENAVALATRLISRFDGLGGVARTSYAELCEVKGLSHAKVCQLLAAFELGKRVASLRDDDRVTIANPQYDQS